MPDIDPQILSVALTFFVLLNSAKSTIKEFFNGRRLRAKAIATSDDTHAAFIVGNETRAMARRDYADPYSTMESHIVRGLTVVLLLFAVYKLIIAEVPHQEPQQRTSLSQIQFAHNSQQWEYSVLNKTLSEADLNNLGNEGWELISHKFEMESKVDTFIFKRRKS